MQLIPSYLLGDTQVTYPPLRGSGFLWKTDLVKKVPFLRTRKEVPSPS